MPIFNFKEIWDLVRNTLGVGLNDNRNTIQISSSD